MTQPHVLILAGGAAHRFWPLRDKQLIEFGSHSLLGRHVSQLRALGCDRFTVVVRPDMRDAVLALGAGSGDDVRIVEQARPLGMGDAVLSARDALLESGDAPVYVTQAHDVLEPDFHAGMLGAWAARDAAVAGLVAAARMQAYFPGGYLVREGERVTSVIEKPGAGNEPSDLVNVVAHVFASARSLAAAVEETSREPGGDDAYERGLTLLMRTAEVRSHVYSGRWQALKYPWHTLDVMEMLLDLWQRGLESPGDGYEQREDGVFIGRDVRVFPGAHVVAPALIGHGSVIGHNALVRGSIVGPRCVIGFGSEVARSYLGEGVELHHNYVGDSVMDRGTSMGYGATTANFRLDGRSVPSMVAGERVDSGRMKLGLVQGAGTKIGVNTSTMPGVKIGSGAIIGPMLKVTRDVPDGERVLDEEKYGRF
jgi:bifunctional UDP-N-acetylglucosamine pyrophosphorylase/glucosamine-1-phosphate N-acetyltransferase